MRTEAPISRLAFRYLCILIAASTIAAQEGGKRAPPNTINGQKIPKKHPQQPSFQQVSEEDIPAGTTVKTIREGEVLDLTGGAKREAKRKYSKGVETIFDAVMTDDPSEVDAALAAGISINIRGPQAYTPLFQAVLSHKMNVAHFLLSRGADTSLRNAGGFTPLDASAFGGCAKCLRMLIAHPGADPAAVGPDGYNALHRAIWGDEEGHTEAVELLLEAGLSPTKPADVPGMGLIPPINMVNENEATRRLLQRWIKKKKKGAGIPGRDAKVGELEADAEKAVEEAQCREQPDAQTKGGQPGTKGTRANTFPSKLPPNVKVTEVRVSSPPKDTGTTDDTDEDDED